MNQCYNERLFIILGWGYQLAIRKGHKLRSNNSLYFQEAQYVASYYSSNDISFIAKYLQVAL